MGLRGLSSRLCWGVIGLTFAAATGRALPVDSSQAATPDASRPAPVIEGTMMRTARSNGRWQTFFNARDTRFRAANGAAIWFGAGENLWRYDVADKKIDAVVTPLTHPDFRLSGAVALADNGDFAIASGAHIYLWTPRNGWSRLPQVSSITNDHFPVFDDKSNLFVSNYQGFYSWSGGLWKVFQQPSTEKRLVPVGDGWAQLKDSMWYDHALGQHRVFAHGAGRNANMAGFFRVKGEGFAFFWAPPQGQSWDHAVGHLYKVTPETLQELGSGKQLGLDLASGEGFRCVVAADKAHGTIESMTGRTLGRIVLPENFPDSGVMLRDANGDYWSGAQRFDGRTWQPVLPPGAFDYAGDMQAGILTGRLQLDERKHTWVDTTPEIPTDVQQYDPKTRTGWLKREKYPGSNERTVWDQIEFDADGTRKILQSVPADDKGYPYCAPLFADAQGNWWFRARWRWDGKYAHVYDEGYETRNMKENIVPPELLLSDAGTVWQYKMDRSWQRYDPQKDRFEPGEPYDDFSFTLGGRTFSIPARTRDKDFNDAAYVMYEKIDGNWAPFKTPFGVSALAWRSPWAFGLPGVMVRGSRMLVATQGGIFEWDVKRDVWAYLMPREQYWAFFDAQGRCIMSGDKLFNQILVYDGDPIAPDAAAEPAATKVLARLLQRMDDDAWRTRNDATLELANLLRQNPATVADYLQRQLATRQLSIEVQARIEAVLHDRPPPHAAGNWYDEYRMNLRKHLGNSLFSRMVQPLTPSFPGGYVIRLGMDYDLAQSILLSSGAQEMLTIRENGDPRCRGFLLRDGTMAYLRIDPAAKPPKITQLGMGPFGGGLDKNWNWDDAGRNGAKSIELDPAPAAQAKP